MNQKLFEPELLDIMATALTGNLGFAAAQIWLLEQSDGALWRRAGHHTTRNAPPVPGRVERGNGGDRPGGRAARADRYQRSG